MRMRTLSDVYLNAVASLYNYARRLCRRSGVQGTGTGVYDLNTFTDEAIMYAHPGGDWYDGGFWQDCICISGSEQYRSGYDISICIKW